MTSPRKWRGWRGYALAVGTALVCAGIREALQAIGAFYYLPLVPAVVITAMLAGRGPVFVGIMLSVTSNLLLTHREGPTDAVANAVLFCGVSWLVAELCWAQRRDHQRAIELSRSLADRSALLDTVLTSVPVVVLDRAGRVRRMTAAAGEMFAVDPRKAENWPFSHFVHGFDIARFESPDGAPPASEVWIGRRPDGRPLIVTLQLGIMADETMEGDYAALCLVDVTEAQAAHERLREQDAQLNRIWRLNSLGEMAATLAHELNQPLSAAATYMQASQRDIDKAGLLGQSAGRTMELAKNQLLRAGGIIKRMRDLLATGTRTLQRERVSDMLDDLEPSLALIGRERSVDIRIEIEDHDDVVRAERIQFQQALMNLVRNAADAVTNHPDPAVLISGHPIADDLYRISVEDNGAGIPTDQVERIFQPMTTTKSGGMGLGLSVTRTIVESHGGNLAVTRSRLGGAAFLFDLPRDGEDR